MDPLVKIDPSNSVTRPTASAWDSNTPAKPSRPPMPQVTPNVAPFGPSGLIASPQLNQDARVDPAPSSNPSVFEPWDASDDPEQYRNHIEPWQVRKTYFQGDAVAYNGDVYLATETVRPKSALVGNPDFIPIDTTKNEEYLKLVGSIDDQLNKNEPGPVVVSSDYPLGNEAYIPNKSYEKGSIVVDQETGEHFIARNKTTPNPGAQSPPDVNPSFEKMDNTQPPGNTLSATTRPDGTTERIPIAQRVQQSMQRSVQHLEKALATMKQPWSDELKQKMDKLFPGISNSQAGKDRLANELSIQLDRMKKSVESDLNDVQYYHKFEYKGVTSMANGFADLRNGTVHIDVDNKYSDEDLDGIMLHEFSHVSVLSRDFYYINKDGEILQNGGWANRVDKYPDWQWHNADSLSFGIRVLAGVI
jgi:hypothetical protein